MAIELNLNQTKVYPADTIIYEKNQQVESVALIMQGRVEAIGDGIKTEIGSGNFLGMYDAKKGKHSFTYKALDNITLYVVPAESLEQLSLLLDEKKEYRGLFVTSMNFFLSDIYTKYTKLEKNAKELGTYLLDLYHKYKSITKSMGMKEELLSSIQRIDAASQPSFSLGSNGTYYLEATNLPPNVQKDYYAGNKYIAQKHIREQVEFFNSLIEGCKYYTDWILRYMRTMIMDERNLFVIIGKACVSMKSSGRPSEELEERLDDLLKHIDETENLLSDYAGIKVNVNREKMEKIYLSLLSDGLEIGESFDGIDREILNDSLEQILNYAPIHIKVASDFRDRIEDFIGLTDKFSKSEEARNIRRQLTDLFFEVYRAVVKKSFDDHNIPRVINMFLRYGYVSEELLTEKELQFLLSQPEMFNSDLDVKVYTMSEWLKEIYLGEKMPSKNEFDEDYEEYLKRTLSYEEDEEKLNKALQDADAKVDYEIENVFKYADRIVSGNLSSFIPIICSENISMRLETSTVTGIDINKIVRKYEIIDFSIFYVENVSSYIEADINRFDTIERFTPEFILFPVYGQRGMLWQDREGKNKYSNARIFLPALFESDLEQEILKLLAYFRWEKCKSEMGIQWNNYRYPSLTSEYSDYLHFYKKNSDLTAMKKDKVKAQLQRANNKFRDVFARDYIDWVSREAQGIMKLNKVAREILFTYCPFSKEITNGLMVQNAYKDAARRYIVSRKKTEKNITSATNKFGKIGKRLPKEIVMTKEYLLDR